MKDLHAADMQVLFMYMLPKKGEHNTLTFEYAIIVFTLDVLWTKKQSYVPKNMSLTTRIVQLCYNKRSFR